MNIFYFPDIEEKRLRLEEAEKKRQAMLQAMNAANKKGPNFTVTKKDPNVSFQNIRNCRYEICSRDMRVLKTRLPLYLFHVKPKECASVIRKTEYFSSKAQ